MYPELNKSMNFLTSDFTKTLGSCGYDQVVTEAITVCGFGVSQNDPEMR